jgi:hypothetical protein
MCGGGGSMGRHLVEDSQERLSLAAAAARHHPLRSRGGRSAALRPWRMRMKRWHPAGEQLKAIVLGPRRVDSARTVFWALVGSGSGGSLASLARHLRRGSAHRRACAHRVDRDGRVFALVCLRKTRSGSRTHCRRRTRKYTPVRNHTVCGK